MIIDDRFVRIGSSNLNNRSLGYDTECDLAVEAESDPAVSKAIRELRNRLLAEHLGCTIPEVRQQFEQSDSLLFVIGRLQGNSRTLAPLEPGETEMAEFIIEEQDLFDPERPIEPENFFSQWLPIEQLQKGRFRWIQLTGVLVVVLGFALAWRFSPLEQFLSPDQLTNLVATLHHQQLNWLYVLGAYLAGSLLIVPITFLITLTVLVFGPYEGFVLAMLGSLLSGTSMVIVPGGVTVPLGRST